MNRLFHTLYFILISSICFGQVQSKLSTESIVPSHGFFHVEELQSIKQLPEINISKLKSEDESANSAGFPHRFGTSIDVDYSSKKDGTWFIRNDSSRVWKLKIHSKKAFSLNFIFSKLILPEGAQLYIYNNTKTMTYGPVRREHIKNQNRFSSDLIQGSTAIIELLEPKHCVGKSLVEIEKVIHGYVNMFPQSFSGFGESDDCHIDISCYPSYDSRADGVVMVLLADNTRHCSGALLTNACQDFTPNILTAFHCVDIGNNGIPNEPTAFTGTLSQTEEDNVDDWVFRFQYKSQSCGGPEPPSYLWFTYGAQDYISGWKDTDFALIRMEEIPDAETGIRYQGWSRNTPSSTFSIHHPQGDVMKFSYDNDPPVSMSYQWTGYNAVYKSLTYPADHFWDINFTGGGIEPGSSGGPLFDGYRRIVGQLWGGAACPDPRGYYGRFDESWAGSGQSDERLDIYLTNDPSVQKTDILALPNFYLSGNYVVTTSSSSNVVIYNTQSIHDVTWTSSSNLNIIYQDDSYATVKYSGYGYGEGIVTAHVQHENSTLCPVEAEFEFTLQAGPFTESQVDINGFSGTTCYNTEYGYTAYVPGGHQSNYTYTWDYPQGWTVVSQWNNHIILNSQNYVYSAEPIGVVINNGAGPSDWSNIWVYNGYCSGYSYSYSYYPNPVHEELTVTVKATDTNSTTRDLSKEEVSFNVKLFDFFQQKVAEKESCENEVKIDIQNLKKGIYIMHIIDQNGKVKKERVIVE